ncbi:universal stress protein [Georgenia satyanarayanai]|uniref:universal stress protein n=1 Tax=Georgenia satyanarayanai TaxID=860221 RepID=UPI00186AD7B5|nr:universal stress protein [Georgenia satyanarayanai]
MDAATAPQGAVVAGVDGSALSTTALLWAAAEAERIGAPLHVVHAVIDAHMTGKLMVLGSDGPGDPEELGAQVCTDAASTVSAAHPHLTVTTEVRVGRAAPQLIEASRGASMVVLGARGHGRVGGLLVGSVSQQVALHAQCTVVVVRETDTAGPVVVGMDGSQEAVEALRFALRHAAGLGTAVRVVRAEYVETPPGVPTGEWYGNVIDHIRELTETVRSTVDDAVRDHPELDIELRVVHQHPVDALIEQSTKASLLVVGSRGLGGFAGLLLGSVSQAVLSQAVVPVAILPHAGQPRNAPEARGVAS